jgi:DNA (cytosine-5)-methyltransferase 1
LRLNRPDWRVIESDVREVNGREFSGVDLLAGGVPCPPFSVAGKQLGENDERDLFPEAIRLVKEIQPRAVMLENVPGFASEKFADYRAELFRKLHLLGYVPSAKVLQAADFGVPQLRPRFILVAVREKYFPYLDWNFVPQRRITVGQTLFDLMSANGWPGAAAWAKKANNVAPTLVGGSKKHGGPDLVPTRARSAWAALGVDGMGLAEEAPHKTFARDGMPRLTVRMTARIQGFPDDWNFYEKKTAAYRQVGNAFPPPVSHFVGNMICAALVKGDSSAIYQQEHHIAKTVLCETVKGKSYGEKKKGY